MSEATAPHRGPQHVTNHVTSHLTARRDTDAQEVMGAATNVQVEAFRNKDIYALVEPFRPVIDGVEYTAQMLEQFRDGRWNRDKSLVVGGVSDELAQTMTIFRKRGCGWKLFYVSTRASGANGALGLEKSSRFRH